MEVLDQRESMLIGDPPHLIAALADALHVELPGRVARTIPELGEDIDREAVAVPRERAGERLAVALAHDDAGGAGRELRAGELECRGAVGRFRELGGVGRPVPGSDDALEALQQAAHAVAVLGVLCGRGGCRSSNTSANRYGQRQNDRQANLHGQNGRLEAGGWRLGYMEL